MVIWHLLLMLVALYFGLGSLEHRTIAQEKGTWEYYILVVWVLGINQALGLARKVFFVQN